jgi:hypothetical protein
VNWYASVKTASRPPAYLVERVSDLGYASELSLTSPGAARSVLDCVISQLSAHMDDEYVESLRSASRAMLDSPNRARSIIDEVVSLMAADRDRLEEADDEPWRIWIS